MLDSLRKYANSWVAQLLMGILVLSFGVWGVSDIFTGFRSNDVARVGSTEITVTDFQRDYNAMIQSVSRQIGQDLTPDQARQAGIPGQVIGRLVNHATLDNAAGKMGLGISDGLLATKIASDPQFVSTTGKFDRNYLEQIIRSMGFTDDDFIVNQRRDYVRNQLAQAFAGGLAAPDTYLRAVQDFSSELRTVSYVILTAPAASAIPDPGDTDLTAYFNAHKATWNAPEVRAVSYFSLSPTDAARTDDVTDDDAKKAYDAQPDRFSTPEKRDVEQVVFKDRAEADQVATALSGGKTFDQLLTDRKLTPADVDLGVVTKDKIVDPAIASAAFALAVNAVSPVVEGQFGPAILRVTSITPATVTPFDQAKDGLKKELAQQRAVADIGNMHDAIEDARAAGGTLADAAAKYSLKVVAIASVDAQGNDADGKPVTTLPTGLVAAAFQSDVGLQNDPLQPDSSSYVWYDVTAVTAPRERPLAEVHDRVVASWKDAERTKQLDASAAALKTRLDNKEDLATVAASLGLAVKTTDKLTRLAKPSGDLSADALGATFASQKGAAAVANGPDPMSRLVLVVEDIVVPPFVVGSPELAQAQQTLDNQLTNAFLNLYVAQLQSQANVKFNQLALQQALGVTDTTTN
jgi:peptidyl-prolyl cis-trans isomerase D